MDMPSVWEIEVKTLAPLRWYRLGETNGSDAQDSSENEVHATYVGGATFNSRGSLVVGDDDPAIFFDKGQQVSLDPAIPADYPFSVATIFHAPSVGDTWNARYLFSWRDPNDSRLFSARIINSGGVGPGKLQVQIFDGGSNFRQITSSARVDDGATYLLVVSATSASSVTVYLNDVAMTDIATGGTPPAIGPYDFAAIGNETSSGSGNELPTLGEVDEFLIFDFALSAAQASTLYDAAFVPWDEDTPTQRINRILDYVGFPSTSRDLDTGSAQLGPFSG